MVRLGKSGGILLVFGALSLGAVLTGAFVSASSEVPSSLWIRNIAAWGIGALAAWGIASTARPGALPYALWMAPAGLVATMLSADQEGVHRWVDLGPLHMNAAMVLLPAAVVALAGLASGRRWPWIAALATLGLLVAQPDASQATAFAAAAALIAAIAVRPPILRGGLVAAAAILAALAWLRPDPLQPVPEVEGIIGLAFSLSPLAAVVAWLFLLATAAAPAVVTFPGSPSVRLGGAALSLCLLLWAVTPLLGAFPVPFVGIGLSPIIGAWLGVGLLSGLAKENRAAFQAIR